MSVEPMEDVDMTFPDEAKPRRVHYAQWAHRLVYEIVDNRVERPLFAVLQVASGRVIRMRVPAGLSLGDAETFVQARTPVPMLENGASRRFVLTFNPTAHTGQGHQIPATSEELEAAFLGKVGKAGFEPLDCRLTGLPPIRMRKSPVSPTITQAQAIAAGTLRVTDASTFHQTLRSGIGAGKAYGLGLLILLQDNTSTTDERP